MSEHRDALDWAEAQVAAARDDPPARLALIARTYYGPTGRAPRHLPFRRAAFSFMRWQVRRGLLNPLDTSPPGSVWWRAMNERLLRDGCEAIALVGGLPGEPSSQAVRRGWSSSPPQQRALVPGSQRQHRGWLPGARRARRRRERSGALLHERRAGRVLFAHALVAAPRLALGRLAGLARLLGDPRLGVAGAFLSLRRVVPNQYPLARDVEWYITDEQRLGRMLDYAVIVPRLQRLYEWSAQELAESRLLELIRDGNPIYAWPFEERHVWRSPHMPFAAGYSNASHGLVDAPPANGPASRRPQASSCRKSLP